MSEQASADELAWEADRRPRVAGLAAAAAALTLGGGILGLVGLGRVDEAGIVTLTEALRTNLEGEGTARGGSAAQLIDIGQSPAAIVLSRAGVGLGAVLLLLVLGYLFRAVLHRRPAGRLPIALSATGAIVYAVASVVSALGLVSLGRTLADASDQSNSAVARLAEDNLAASASPSFAAFAGLLLGAGMVMICLHAMRAGLLTRFLGVLGILVGGTFILSGTPLQLDQPPIIRSFWLGGVALMLIGRTPSGLPPAWASGRAEPWPSGRPAPRAAGTDAPAKRAPEVPEPTPRAAHPSSRKRRKRRR